MPAATPPPDAAPGAPPSIGIDLVELETFVAVAQLGSFSLAAQQLHVTQPSVTGRVQRLEQTLGTRLLVRTTRRVETTPQGRRLLERAVAALSGLRAVVDEFRHDARRARQRVVVAATQMLAALMLPPIIRAYRERHPDVQVELRDLSYDDTLAALDGGDADLGVLAYVGTDPRFAVRPLRREPMRLVVPATHPLAGRGTVGIEQLAAFPLLLLQPYEPFRERIADALGRRGLAMPPPVVAANVTTLLGMLDAGMGATLLPRPIAERSRDAGHAVVVLEDFALERRYCLVQARRAEPGTAVQSFCRFLVRATAEATG